MRYEAPETMKSAVTLMSKEKGLAFVLAGGTDLLVKMKGGFLEPDLVVDIKRIKGVYDIKKSATGFTIGAAVPGVALAEKESRQVNMLEQILVGEVIQLRRDLL